MDTTTQPEYIPTLDASQATVHEMFATILAQRLQAGAMEQAITKQVDQLIANCASDAFRTYSDLGKAISKQLTAAIMPNIDNLSDMPTYHHFVTNRLKLAAQDFYDTRLAEVLDKELAEIMSEVPEQITLSWLVKELIEDAQSYGEPDGEHITLKIEPSSSQNFLMVYLDKSEGTNQRDCSIRLHLHDKDKTGKHEIIGLNVDDIKAGDRLCMGRMYSFEKKLFNVFAMKGQIELDQGTDPDNYDTYCGHDD